MKIFSFFWRLIVVGLLVIWLVDSPGTARIVWHDIVIETSASVLFVIITAISYALFLVYRLWRFLWDSPRFWKLKRRLKKLEEGQKEIVMGLASLASSDAVQAGVHAVRARKLLGETSNVRLLQAQSAQLAGDHATAKIIFTTMAKDSDAAVLGYRGLIMAALRNDDFDEALSLAMRLEKEKGEIPWLHVLRFQIASQLENWPLALTSLEKARKKSVIIKTDADKHEAALLLAQAKKELRASAGKEALALAEKANRIAPLWVPSLLILIEAQIVTGHERAALRALKKAWRQVPHPQFAPLVPWALKGSKPIEVFKRIQKMTRDNSDDPINLMVLAEAALKADLWGEARRALMSLITRGQATHLTYQMLARLERKETGNERVTSSWLARAVTAPVDPVWLCCSCGAAHEYWDASCVSCGAFNKMIWATPGKARQKQEKIIPISYLDVIK